LSYNIHGDQLISKSLLKGCPDLVEVAAFGVLGQLLIAMSNGFILQVIFETS